MGLSERQIQRAEAAYIPALRFEPRLPSGVSEPSAADRALDGEKAAVVGFTRLDMVVTTESTRVV